MTTYELYINGILCDLPGDSAISLLYQSPIFSGLDAIQSNRSYNIALPITPKNRGAIEFAERPDIDSDAPYIKLSASLYQDGVPIFTQGYAVVTDITDTINVTLTWGNVNNFQPLFDSNLRDLGPEFSDMGGAGVLWNNNSTIRASNELDDSVAADFIGVDFGKGLSNPEYIHPSASIKYILYAIETHNNIKIENVERLWDNLSPAPILPLVSKNGIHKGLETYAVDGGSGYIMPGQIKNDPNNWAGSIGVFARTTDNDGIGKLYISFRNFSILMPGQTSSNLTISIKYGDFDSSGGISETETKQVMISSLKSGYTYYFNDIIVDYGMSQFLQIVVSPYKYTGEDIVISGVINVWQDSDSNNPVVFPDVFPVVPNLPDVSQGDFILALMSMNGLFAYADKDDPNTIKLISIDDIMDNAANGNIVDWSNRVIVNEARDVSRPESSAFTIDDFAQNNILDYDNDDEINTDTSGIITVDNVNIDKETELVEMPFSASRNGVSLEGVNCAWIPIYEDNGQGGVNYSEVSPRILAWKNDQSLNNKTICTGRFDSWMEFGGDRGIVKSKYASYQEVIKRLRIITIRAKLTPLDLYDMDYTKPVYISQFGQLYAIFSVESGDDGICECQLLKLKSN